MKRTEAIVAVVLSLSLVGCVAQSKPNSTNTLPPVPQPVVEAPPAPPQPLSIPQTQVELPAPQPVSAEALAAVRLPAEPANVAPPTPVPAGRGATAARPPQPKPEPQAATAVVGPPAAANAEPERPTIGEIIPANEQRQLQEQAAQKQKEARQLLDQIKKRRMSSAQRATLARAESFLTQSRDAEKLNDMRQAEALAERSLVLAQELQGGK